MSHSYTLSCVICQTANIHVNTVYFFHLKSQFTPKSKMDCFGLSCRVFEILAVEMSFNTSWWCSKCIWKTHFIHHDPVTHDNPPCCESFQVIFS